MTHAVATASTEFHMHFPENSTVGLCLLMIRCSDSYGNYTRAPIISQFLEKRRSERKTVKIIPHFNKTRAGRQVCVPHRASCTPEQERGIHVEGDERQEFKRVKVVQRRLSRICGEREPRRPSTD